MKLSVIVPIYNVEKYLPKCLDSLVNQTLKDIEIIIVNDASPDNSKKIIEKYLKKYKNIKYFEKENGGQGSARNLGLKHAKGKYIAYVDSDDYIELDMFEKMYNKAVEDNSDVVICGHNLVDLNYNVVDKYLPVITGNIKEDILLGNMAVWNKIYKKDIIDIDFREKLWYEDIDFTAKLLLGNKKISFVNEALYNYLLRPGSTMNNKNAKRNLELLSAFTSMKKYFKGKKLYKKVYEDIEFLAIYHIYIMGITRLIRIDIPSKEKNEYIKEYIKYMNIEYPDFKKSKYIKYIPKNRKIIYHLINMRLYGIVKLIFKIKHS